MGPTSRGDRLSRSSLARVRVPSSLAAALAAALLLATATPARASGGDEASLPASITVSGGVSLGAYEAGFLYYTLATVHGDPRMELKLLTGASAGSLNSLLALLAACGTEVPSPAKSLLWETWIPVDFDRLFVPAEVTRLGVFSRDWLDRSAAHIEQGWNRGLDRSCDVVLGVSTTRVKPRKLKIADRRLELPRMEEKFAIRIQGRGPGVPPRATNYVDSASPREEPLLVTDAGGEIAFSELADLLIASMSFPVAFPPREIRTCASGATANPGVCLPSEAESALYVDGGVFDNAPLRLAVQLAGDGLRAEEGGGAEWREVPLRGAEALPPEMSFAFLDPDATEYPASPAREGEAETPSIARLLGAIGAAFLDTARSKELATLVEEHPDIAQAILLPRRHFPAASAPMIAFLGFFETEFRVFDFHLGMYDARKMFERQVERRAHRPLRYPEPSDAAADPRLGGWGPFACLRAVYDGIGSAAEACGSDELEDFRALLQVSLDGLYSACSEAVAEGGEFPWGSAHCRRAAAGEPPPAVPGVPGLDARRAEAWKRGAKEPELAYSMRLLGDYGFRFRDLGVPAGRGDLAVARIRTRLGSAAQALADAQPPFHRFAVGRTGKLAADLVAYSPPDRVIHLTTGPTETELGASRGFSRSGWLPRTLRFTGAVAFRGLGEILSAGESDPFGVAAVAGFELQPLVGNPILSQLRVGLRAGWLFAADDDYGTGRCVERGSAHVSSCSRPVVQAVVGLTALERFRVQLVGEWYPGSEHRETAWSIAPGLGLEFAF